jgi:hypothetical protein
MLYVGIAWTTALINISLPAWDKNLTFHSSNFFCTLLHIPAKVLFLDRPTIEGSPKYLSKLAAIWIPAVLQRKSLKSTPVFLLKKTDVFAAFNYWPEARSYKFRTWEKFSHSSSVALQNNRESSANSKWLTLCPPAKIGTPEMRVSSSAFVSKELSPSATIKNKYGDSGSPCQSPLEGQIFPKGTPFTNTE